MSQADYIARYAKRQSLKEAVETYWIDEPRSEFSVLTVGHYGLDPPASVLHRAMIGFRTQ